LQTVPRKNHLAGGPPHGKRPRIEGHYIVVGEEPEVSGHDEDVAPVAQFWREDELIDPLGKLLLRPLGIPKQNLDQLLRLPHKKLPDLFRGNRCTLSFCFGLQQLIDGVDARLCVAELGREGRKRGRVLQSRVGQIYCLKENRMAYLPAYIRYAACCQWREREGGSRAHAACKYKIHPGDLFTSSVDR
jgi:hypothetical protein